MKAEGPENGVYVRLGSTNRQADRELIAELRRSAEGIAFDELPMPELSTGDLDLAAVKSLFRGDRKLGEEELITLKLLTHEQGRVVPTKGAVLLFGKDRIRYFPDAWMQCGRFMGQDKAEIFDHIELHDHLPRAVESIMLFLKKHAMRGADFSEIRRKDVWSIPLGILREVVINALVHADYSQRGAPTRIAFFDDRIEVENPGILLPGMTIEDMKHGVSKIRNSVIARIFRELDLIEQWGSGVRRIFKEAEEQKLPEPQIVEIGMRMRFIVPLAEPNKIQSNTKQIMGEDALPPKFGESPAISPTQSPTQSTIQSDDPVIRLIRILLQGPLSSGELRKQLNLKHRPTFRKNYLHPALKQGHIEMTVPEKPNSRLQKYRLTQKGKAVIDAQRLDDTEKGALYE
jgi:ATP-dependent DNA helicase RecG